MCVLLQLGARREPGRSRCFPDVLAAVKDGHVTLGTHWAPAQWPRMAEHRDAERRGPWCLCWAHHTQFGTSPPLGFLLWKIFFNVPRKSSAHWNNYHLFSDRYTIAFSTNCGSQKIVCQEIFPWIPRGQDISFQSPWESLYPNSRTKDQIWFHLHSRYD